MKAYQHILVPVDFSQNTVHSVSKALQLATCFDAKVSLLHVLEDMPLGKVAFGGTQALKMNPTVQQNQINLAQEKMKRLFETHNIPETVHADVVYGKAEDIMVQFVKEQAVDLVVMCTSGKKTGFSAGSMTLENVVRALQCDVLGVRAAV